MIEYIYDVIRATSGEEITVNANITNSDGNVITENCNLKFYDDKGLLFIVEGACDGENWSFTIPAEATQGLSGKYYYNICEADTSLNFKQAFYLM